jgi:hypothetical protein
MNKMSIAVIAALSVIPCLAIGQGRGNFDPAKMHQMMVQRQKETRTRLIKELKMSAVQIKSYDALMAKENAVRMKMFASMGGGKPAVGGMKPGMGGPGMGGMQDKMKKMRAEHEASMKKILNAPQFGKYLKLEEQMRQERMKQRGMGGPGVAHPGGGH